MKLKLKRYTTIEFNINTLIKTFNAVKLNVTAADYANGLSLSEINTDTILAQHKYDKASKLPFFMEYQNASINLSVTMPDCSATKATLDTLTSLRNDYSNSQFKEEMNCISFDKKTDQFVINQTGKDKLEAAIVTLTKQEETAYNALFAAHAALLSINSKTPQHFFKDTVANAILNNNLRPDDVITYLRYQ